MSLPGQGAFLCGFVVLWFCGGKHTIRSRLSGAIELVALSCFARVFILVFGVPLYFDPYVPFVSLKTLSPVFIRDVARRSLSFSKNSASSIGKVTGCPSHEDR